MPLDFDHLTSTQALAGAGGSLVSLKFAPGATWKERAFNFAAGTMAAIAVAPAIAEWLKLTSPAMLSGLSFSVGLFGLSVAAAITAAVRDAKLADVLPSWLTRKD